MTLWLFGSLDDIIWRGLPPNLNELFAQCNEVSKESWWTAISLLDWRKNPEAELDRRIQESGGALFIREDDPLHSYIADILNKNPDRYTRSYIHSDYWKSGWTVALKK